MFFRIGYIPNGNTSLYGLSEDFVAGEDEWLFVLCWKCAPGERVETGDGLYVRSKAFVKVFEVVGVVVFERLIELRLQVEPLREGFRSNVFNDSFGLVPAGVGPMGSIMSGEKTDRDSVISNRGR